MDRSTSSRAPSETGPVDVRLDRELANKLQAAGQHRSQDLDSLVDSVLRTYLASDGSDDDDEEHHGTHELNLANETLRSIVEAVVTVDRLANVEYMNPSAEEMTGWPLEEAIGLPIDEVAHLCEPSASWISLELVQDCLRQGESVDVDDGCELITRMGHHISVQGVATPLRNASGNMAGAALVIRDVRHQKEIEAQLVEQRNKLEALVEKRTHDLVALQGELLKKERLATLGQLTAMVGHEIRNPLGTIQNTMQVLCERLKPQNDARMDRMLDRILRNVNRCNRITEELLDYSQIRPANIEMVELDAWLTGVLDEFKIPDGVQILREFSCPDPVPLDPHRMRRVLVNLYDNACQAMTDAEDLTTRQLRIQTSKGPSSVEIVVHDTGPGMPPEVQANIFEAFFTTKRFGLGLGLPIVRQIVEQHRADIHYQSNPGEGTRVTLRLPLSME